MLVLARTVGQKIVINNEITVVVVSIIGNKAKLGIEAPPHVSVNREEVQDAINRGEGRAA